MIWNWFCISCEVEVPICFITIWKVNLTCLVDRWIHIWPTRTQCAVLTPAFFGLRVEETYYLTTVSVSGTLSTCAPFISFYMTALSSANIQCWIDIPMMDIPALLLILKRINSYRLCFTIWYEVYHGLYTLWQFKAVLL